jgi:beta-phosphoglucomutase
MTNTLQACIFDLDGVIVDTAHFHFLAWKRLADELAIPFTEADNEHLKGVSRIDSLQFLLKLGNKTLSENHFQDCLHRKNEWFLAHISQMTPADALEGIPEFLEALKQSPIRIALGSASKNAQLILDRIGLTHYFEVLIDGNQIEKAKPAPDVFLKGAEGLQILPANCVVFEDGIAGIEAAHHAHMKAIGIGSIKNLHMADYVMSDFKGFDLPALQDIWAKFG